MLLLLLLLMVRVCYVLRFQPRFHGLEDAESRLDVLGSIGHYTFLVEWISETDGCHLRRRVVARLPGLRLLRHLHAEAVRIRRHLPAVRQA